MPRYVVLSRDRQPAAEDVESIVNEPGVTLIDDAVGRVLLIEASEPVAERLREHLPSWIVSPETLHPRPGLPRQSIKSDKGDDDSG